MILRLQAMPLPIMLVAFAVLFSSPSVSGSSAGIAKESGESRD